MININFFSTLDILKREHIHEVYEDGSVYEGEKLNELRHGRGKFFYADGGMYDGEWRQGRMHGYGHLYYPSGEVAYEGEWREDKFNGKGIVYNENPIELKAEFDYTNFQTLCDHWKGTSKMITKRESVLSSCQMEIALQVAS